ncbi:MAG TPA: hypothetical protein VHA35_17760 [Dongiaceae bacterium]|jgi:hypothetical protein|nr:hypothetical protein [Dongiaceae bacterium]
MNLRRSFVRPLAAAAVLAAIGASAGADPIPQAWLANVKNGCVKSCTAQLPAAACETACTCVAQQTAATMDKDEFLAVNTMLEKNQPVPPALESKAQAIQDRCQPAQ